MIYGTRIALGVAVPSVLGALVIGLVLGVVAGYCGGMLDNALIVVMDSLQAFPAVILALVLLALLGSSLQNVIIVITVAFIPNYARVSRALVLALKNNQFVEAERSLGASPWRLVVCHILPNILAPLFILLAMDIPSAITVEAGLSFLGLGVQPPTASWGVILADGFARVEDSPWGVIAPGLALMITTLAFTLLGETLRDVVDPRLSGVRRWRRRWREPEAAAARGRRPRDQLPRARAATCRRSTTSRSRSSRARSSASWASRAAASRRSSSALMQLLPPNGEITGGGVSLRGRDLSSLLERRDARAARPRDRDDLPGSADEPEPDVHDRAADGRRAARAPPRREPRRAATARDRAARRGRASPTPPTASATTRTSSRAACGSGS